ncbi:MAG: hypothetical protein LBS74_10525 [Oscillospiraceae bacterium]|jgi:hypothetical protein|nr:hypothetical protein [Oscillospiraceae bacterium]
MLSRVFAEFDNLDLGESAARTVRSRIEQVGKIIISARRYKPSAPTNSLTGDSMRHIPAMSSPVALAALNSSYTDPYESDSRQGKFEPAQKASVVLSLVCESETANRVSGLLSSLGGRNVRVVSIPC